MEKSCGAIIELDGKILLIKQKNSGNVGFPKGHIMENETEIECAIREVKEETNVDIVIEQEKKYSISYTVKNNINKEVVYFIARPIDDIVLKKQDSEIEDIYWVDKNKVKDLLTYDNLKNLYDKVLLDL